MSIKEISIREYLSNIDFKRDDWKISKIEEDMKKFLGEIPGIEINYKKDVMVNEATHKAEEITEIKSIDIVFYDTNDKFKKLSFLID